jgi:hypothetical protein
MSSIQTNSLSSASLASALLSLSAQTNPATTNGDVEVSSMFDGSLASAGADTLNLSNQSTADLQSTTDQIAQQNLSSALNSPDDAQNANNAAINYLGADPTTAQAAQSDQSGTSVLSLL